MKIGDIGLNETEFSKKYLQKKKEEIVKKQLEFLFSQSYNEINGERYLNIIFLYYSFGACSRRIIVSKGQECHYTFFTKLRRKMDQHDNSKTLKL